VVFARLVFVRDGVEASSPATLTDVQINTACRPAGGFLLGLPTSRSFTAAISAIINFKSCELSRMKAERC